MDNAPVLIHVGYIKTATTFLQEVVFSGIKSDLELAAGAATRSHTVHNILLTDDYSFDAEYIRSRMEEFAGPVRLRNKLPVWSEEMLLGNPPSGRYDGFNNARKAHAIYPRAQVLITIRRQQSIALSMYREYVLGGGRLSLRSFIGTGDEPISFSAILRPNFLFYHHAIRHYKNLFVEGRVLCLPQEMLEREPKDYLAALAGFTGREISPDLQLRRIHVGENSLALALRRSLNRFIVRDSSRPGRTGLDAFTNRIVRLFNRLTPRRLEAGLYQDWRDAIDARYKGMFAASNRETAKMTGLNLGDYGYDS
jgi:hypothetical protein